MNGRIQYGILAGASVDDYENGRIKRHELTRKKKEEDRTKLTDIQGANVGPVFLTYPASEEIDSVVSSVIARNAFVDVTTDDGIRHTLWKCTSEESAVIVNCFENIPFTYIADGHHRSASAFNVGKLRQQRARAAGQEITGNEDFNYFMALHYPHNQLKIFDYNRVLRDLNGLTPEQFLTALSENFDILEISERAPPAKHHYSLYLNGKWIGLRIKPEKITGNDPVSNLDSFLLTQLCLAPILGIEDLTTSERIDFVGGIRGLDELERRCDYTKLPTYQEMRQQIFNEINNARTNPQKFAIRMENHLHLYKANKVKCRYGAEPLFTNEGVDAAEEAILELKCTEHLHALEWSDGLSKASQFFCNESGSQGLIGRNEGNQMSFADRIAKFGHWSESIFEAIDYGSVDGFEVVCMLLTDDSLISRPHRKAILNPRFKTIGVGCAPHIKTKTIANVTLSEHFIENAQTENVEVSQERIESIIINDEWPENAVKLTCQVHKGCEGDKKMEIIKKTWTLVDGSTIEAQEVHEETGTKKDCVAAIALYPVMIEEVMAIADAGQIMPPKSTWFEPKPRSGMVVNVFQH
mmetsp:Transcript_12924/g.13026  ORF Transcript_12924/g.13026 Transcript_12924/m.13026 type:complete len:581 (+) Transcript_12924:280-2022(+)|eukprot:CAMPEP_0202949092 /NCGR_PEP_ID=MMETSP1395-20130829/14929_1 /ASSEMBLY_ACC=CAM_ASM_000871 /TAXON_ID=5961 /ORGANISM="Blepharisma japonicum, Strain Stock R1072" /LENGTH=580 /DNA_ID=CAMNT_0049651793 /DNA_START=276 /DNA_END=2018 /DNA_ORIENTATION=+